MISQHYSLLLWGWLATAVFMAALWFVQWRRRDAGIVDVGWAAGMGGLALYYWLSPGGDPVRQGVIGLLAAIWAFRLAFFLYFNRVHGKPEDGRYQNMRAASGKWAQPVFFAFFQIQAFWSVLFSLPFFVAIVQPRSGLGALDFVGIAIWLIAVVGESTADAQLAAWRGNPANKGRTCRAGLWKYSRHPNYFFEWIHWFAYVALAAGGPTWWLALMGPVLMFVFLFKVTGIPWTEKRALQSRGDDYREYQRTTSVFIPWPPKEGRA